MVAPLPGASPCLVVRLIHRGEPGQRLG